MTEALAIPKQRKGEHQMHALAQWAARVRIEIEPLSPSESLSEARHRRTNYDALVAQLNDASAYGFDARAAAYSILKRRVNALLSARLSPSNRRRKEVRDMVEQTAKDAAGIPAQVVTTATDEAQNALGAVQDLVGEGGTVAGQTLGIVQARVTHAIAILATLLHQTQN